MSQNKHKNNTEMSSNDYIYRCLNTLKADKNISDNTIILMFLQYGKLLLEEYEKENKK